MHTYYHALKHSVPEWAHIHMSRAWESRAKYACTALLLCYPKLCWCRCCRCLAICTCISVWQIFKCKLVFAKGIIEGDRSWFPTLVIIITPITSCTSEHRSMGQAYHQSVRLAYFKANISSAVIQQLYNQSWSCTATCATKVAWFPIWPHMT